MPHITIEYSANLDDTIDMPDFCETLRRAAAETDILPLAGIRVRAIRCEDYAIADADPSNAFIDISVRLRAGRPLEGRKAATAHIFTAAEGFLQPYFAKIPLALSLEMRDIDPELSPKCGSIRDHMAKRR
ncbi:MAG: 5-carboxymethyl-2-hydroxymuconate Delta-isomerase [Hyphomicrobiales bacterium]|nr:5-carboxymethyl-2-hydroxymuconate Delta-isomerase [Hyphomicrobiales bacterium]